MSDQPQTVLVVGGGIAGSAAALHVAGAGHRALVIDDAPVLGGALILLDKTFPTDSCGVCFLAPDPPAICPFLECDRNPRITLRPSTTLASLRGSQGAFTAELSTAPVLVDPARCTLCGKCSPVCPQEGESGLLGAAWLGETHKAIYFPFPQATPATYVVDTSVCTRCGKCVEVCPHGAIDLARQPNRETLEVAAVVLAPGFGPNNARVRGAYGYGEYANVITSLEFERMLSTSSPSRGQPIRPSDGQPAQRIAIVHCVGSRDKSCGVPYCSAGCCMIAAKQASLSKRRAPQAEVTVFTMDVRAAGRGYERYLAEVQAQPGLRYRRSLISAAKLEPETQRLELQFAENGKPRQEPFDLVVLEVGMIVPERLRMLAERLGVRLNGYGFAETAEVSPTRTSRAGVFVAGAFREPKDVPATVAESAAAAADALVGLRVLPVAPIPAEGEEFVTPTAYDPPVIGVFLDGDDAELAGLLDLQRLVPALQALADVAQVSLSVAEDHIREKVAEAHLTYVVEGSRSARRNGHGRAAVGGVPVTRVALGAADAYVHEGQPEVAFRKALDLLRMTVEQARWVYPRAVEVELPRRRAVVLGGGVAGLLAARTLSALGNEVDLIERSEALGGWLRGQEGARAEWIRGLAQEVAGGGGVQVHLSSTLVGCLARPGRLHLTVENPAGKADIEVGAVVVATGASEFRPDYPGLGPDLHACTQSELGALLSESSPDALPRSVVMIQCAGTRDADHPYCSKTCCAEALENALALCRLRPDARVAILYRDMVTPGFSEDRYAEARQRGILFVRYGKASPPRVEGRTIEVLDDVLQEEVRLEADLLVLSSGIVADGDSARLGALLGVPLDEEGFFSPLNLKSQLMDLRYPGLYLAGLAGGPATLEETIEQGMGAGLRAALFLRRGLQTPLSVGTVNEEICSGCGLCVHECPVQARHVDPELGVAQVDPWLCVGCGACVAVCPNDASGQALFEPRGILSAVEAAIS